jgi:hypothetical protein
VSASIEELATTGAALTVVAGGLAEIGRRALRYMKAIDQKSQQLEHNGGSSMRDDMSHVRSSIDAIGNQLRAVAVDVLGVHQKLDSLELRQDIHEATHPAEKGK